MIELKKLSLNSLPLMVLLMNFSNVPLAISLLLIKSHSDQLSFHRPLKLVLRAYERLFIGKFYRLG